MNLSFKDFKYDTGRIEVKNIFDPLIKLGMTFITIISILLFSASYFLNDSFFSYFAVYMDGGFILFSCGMYLFFALKDPSRLQSEKHIYDMKKLELNQHQKNEKDITPESLQELSGNIQIDSISVPYEETKDNGDSK
ncbi:MAG: hypothetical protein SH817_10335 [Leptospira sp.]|nr:hypothetical protein [Leptospira sp.]